MSENWSDQKWNSGCISCYISNLSFSGFGFPTVDFVISGLQFLKRCAKFSKMFHSMWSCLPWTRTIFKDRGYRWGWGWISVTYWRLRDSFMGFMSCGRGRFIWWCLHRTVLKFYNRWFHCRKCICTYFTYTGPGSSQGQAKAKPKPRTRAWPMHFIGPSLTEPGQSPGFQAKPGPAHHYQEIRRKKENRKDKVRLSRSLTLYVQQVTHSNESSSIWRDNKMPQVLAKFMRTR